jgi:hypothetical protein
MVLVLVGANLLRKCQSETKVSLGFLHKYTILQVEFFADIGSMEEGKLVGKSLGKVNVVRFGTSFLLYRSTSKMGTRT